MGSEAGSRDDPLFTLWNPRISETAEARRLKFGVAIEGWGP